MSVNKSERSITLKKTLGLFNQTCILINELIYNAENNNKHYLTKTFKQKICKKWGLKQVILSKNASN